MNKWIELAYMVLRLFQIELWAGKGRLKVLRESIWNKNSYLGSIVKQKINFPLSKYIMLFLVYYFRSCNI